MVYKKFDSKELKKNEKNNWSFNDLKVGKKVYGTVINIKPYGAFIRVGDGTVGLLHIEDISVARMKSPEERLKIGQEIPVIIKSIDKKDSKFSLSYKELLGSWQDNIKGIEEGQELKGIVRETAKGNKGIFIELKPNLVGMSEYKPNYNFGDKVNVVVKKIIPEKHKVKLKIL